MLSPPKKLPSLPLIEYLYLTPNNRKQHLCAVNIFSKCVTKNKPKKGTRCNRWLRLRLLLWWCGPYMWLRVLMWGLDVLLGPPGVCVCVCEGNAGNHTAVAELVGYVIMRFLLLLFFFDFSHHRLSQFFLIELRWTTGSSGLDLIGIEPKAFFKPTSGQFPRVVNTATPLKIPSLFVTSWISASPTSISSYRGSKRDRFLPCEPATFKRSPPSETAIEWKLKPSSLSFSFSL